MLRNVLTLISGALLLALGLMFSLVVFVVIAVIGLGVWAYLWWKTRKLRRILQAQARHEQPPNDRIFDGEAVVVDESHVKTLRVLQHTQISEQAPTAAMSILENIDLASDPAAARYVKDEIVQVSIAREAGELTSLEGPNRFEVGDALITGSTGSRWSVSRDRFDAKYEAVAPTRHGEDGGYRSRPLPVLAKQMHEPFALARSAGGDMLYGKAGDWVLQYAPGDYGLAEQQRFMQVYRPAD